MSEIITFDDGEVVDLHTVEGAYGYVGRFLKENGAHGKTFSALESLLPHKVRIRRVGLVSSADWGPCTNCKEIITIKAKYCPGCGGTVRR